MAKKFQQFVYMNKNEVVNKMNATGKENGVDKKNIFLSGQQVYRLGIQGYPGLKFLINKQQISDTSQVSPDLIIGNTGIFEIDLEGTGSYITDLRFSKQEIIDLSSPIIIDIMYEGQEVVNNNG